LQSVSLKGKNNPLLKVFVWHWYRLPFGT